MSTTLEVKIDQLADYHRELQEWLARPRGPEWDPLLRRVLERMIQLLVECAADAGDLWLERHGRPLGQSATTVFLNLADAGILNDEALSRYRRYIGSCNRIVHDYDQVQPQRVRADAEALAADILALIRALLADPAGDPP